MKPKMCNKTEPGNRLESGVAKIQFCGFVRCSCFEIYFMAKWLAVSAGRVLASSALRTHSEHSEHQSDFLVCVRRFAV